MPDVMEAIFDAAYLIFDRIAGILFFVFDNGIGWKIALIVIGLGWLISAISGFMSNLKKWKLEVGECKTKCVSFEMVV